MMTHLAPVAVIIGPEISPVYAPSVAQYRFWAPTSTREPPTASTAAGRLTNGGQMTISRSPVFCTRGIKAWKKARVSTGFLYIFQLPAMTGVRMGLFQDIGQEAGSVGDRRAKLLGHGLADVRERRARAQIDAAAGGAVPGQERRVFAAMVGGRGSRVAPVVRREDQQVAIGQG